MPFYKKYTTINRVVEQVIRNSGFDTEVDRVEVIEWIGEAIDLIGAIDVYEEKCAKITIEDYRGEMPCDWLSIIQTRDFDSKQAYRYETGNYFSNSCHLEGSPDLVCQSGLTYKIQGNYIFSNRKTGCIELAYMSYPTDDQGLPKVPDDTRVIKALESYIRYKVDYRLWRQGKVNRDVFEYSNQEWLFYVNSAKTSILMPSIDQMESLKNQTVRLIPQLNAHSSFFKRLGTQESRRIV